MSDTSRSAAPCLRAAALALAVCCSAWSATAQAWTKTRVEHVQAHLTVDAAGQAQVVLQVGVRVQGGWLSRFEITGLDRDFALDAEQPPLLTGEDGNAYVPEVERRSDGTVVLKFPTRRAAPHRGSHQLALTYRTQLSTNGARVTWALPPWGVDLENASVTVDAPGGTVLAAADEDDVAVRRERAQVGARTQLSFRRAQLPRTVPLAVQFELPADAASAATTLAAHATQERRARSWTTAFAAALVLALCTLKRRTARGLAAQRRQLPLPLFALAAPARAIVMLGLALAFALGYEAHASLGLLALVGVVALALDRGFARAASARPAQAPGTASLAAVARQRARDWFGAPAWFDATTPLGFGLLSSAYALAGLRLMWSARPGLWLEVLLVVTPLWLTATRFHLGTVHSVRTDGETADRGVSEAPPRSAGAVTESAEIVSRADAVRPAQARAA